MIAPHTGITEVGVETSRLEMTAAKAPLTISSTRKITTRNRLRPRAPISRPLSMPMDWPRLRALAHRAPKSCTPAKKMVPNVTHRKAGPQPQITAIAGPTMGAAPATDVKWWPHSTKRLVGT